MVPELTPPLQQGQQQTSGHLGSGSSWTKASSSWLSRLGCVTEQKAIVSLLQAVALELLRKSKNPESAQVLKEPAMSCRDKRLLCSA